MKRVAWALSLFFLFPVQGDDPTLLGEDQEDTSYDDLFQIEKGSEEEEGVEDLVEENNLNSFSGSHIRLSIFCLAFLAVSLCLYVVIGFLKRAVVPCKHWVNVSDTHSMQIYIVPVDYLLPVPQDQYQIVYDEDNKQLIISQKNQKEQKEIYEMEEIARINRYEDDKSDSFVCFSCLDSLEESASPRDYVFFMEVDNLLHLHSGLFCLSCAKEWLKICENRGEALFICPLCRYAFSRDQSDMVKTIDSSSNVPVYRAPIIDRS